ncbi:WD40-repeat-containing domain protein [Mycena epipterygia]|nr:WD40-repeat-containing domain protein [Mycena epipterygia]
MSALWAKLKTKLFPSPQRKQQLEIACSGLKITLAAAKDIADNAGIPGLSLSLGGLLHVLDIAQKMSQNAEDIEDLASRVKELTSVLDSVRRAKTQAQQVTDGIENLSRALENLSIELQTRQSRTFFKRILNYEKDTTWLTGKIRDITGMIEIFNVRFLSLHWVSASIRLSSQVATMHRIEDTVDEIRVAVTNVQIGVQEMHPVMGNIDVRVQEMQTTMGHIDVGVQEILGGSIRHAVKASFVSEKRELCWQNTRTSILSQISGWINIAGLKLGINGAESTYRASSTNPSSVFWINGSAGTGKSTIAATVAHGCSEMKPSALGASFFCSRDDADCSNLSLLFPTIAYQLAQFHAGFATQVALVRKRIPDIGYTYPEYQLTKLIVEPLSLVRDSFPPCVVVLDALDECKDPSPTSTILAALSKHVPHLSPLRFFITSRPQPPITSTYFSKLQSRTQQLHLHEVELPVVQQDIHLYLSSRLSEISQARELERWPLPEDVRTLAKLSAGLFIFAATAIKYIDISDYDPKDQLTRLVSNVDTVGDGLSPSDMLDKLYTEVLQRAFPDTNIPVPVRLRPILQLVTGAIVLLRDPLSPLSLDRLLDLDFGQVRRTLGRLQSVILLPTDDEKVIRLLHPSFFDFLSSPTRCLIPEFRVDPKKQNSLLAERCLDVMVKCLHRDMCRTGDPSLFNSEIKDLPGRITDEIPLHLQYACRHWAYHILNGAQSDTLLHALDTFISNHVLHWMEVCSLLGEVRNALLSVADMCRLLSNSSRVSDNNKSLLNDCERFISAFFTVISASALQVYHPALLFTPEDTALQRIYGPSMKLPLREYNAVADHWSACLRIIEADSDLYTNSIACSSDGTLIASGHWPNTIRIWDAVSGTELQKLKLEGQLHGVFVAFVPGGTHILSESGSGDGTVSIWDAVQGIELQKFAGHSERVSSVAFCPSGTRFVSGSVDTTVRIWDAATGTQLHLLGHPSSIIAVAFSPTGSRIASTCWDCVTHVWDAMEGTLLQKLVGHSNKVRSLAFSPDDDSRIVSGSTDKTVRIWDVLSGSEVPKLQGHSVEVASVAFSPDGARVVTGSHDKTVRIWDLVTGSTVQTLRGHTDPVNSVAFFPDGTRIISGAGDIRIWDVVGPEVPKLQRPHSRVVSSLAFSQDGTKTVSGGWDGAVCIWDAVLGTQLHHLQHSPADSGKGIYSTVFSPDGTRIAYGSGHSNEVHIWDFAGSMEPQKMQGHSSEVRAVAFSPEGTLIAGSSDKTIRIWKLADETELQVLRGHSDGVSAVAFSPDGLRLDPRTTRSAFGMYLQALS